MAFVTASDGYGVGISGVTDGDTFELVSVAGEATFAQETDNDGVAGAITFVAAGSALAAAVFGSSELAPLLNAAGVALGKEFPETKHNAKPRDPFGQESGEDDFARQEGGLHVCPPDAQGPWRSGDDDHQDWWIKSPTDRSEDNFPPQV